MNINTVSSYKSELTNDAFNISKATIKYKQQNCAEEMLRIVTKITVTQIDDIIENLSLINKLLDELATDEQTHVIYKYNKCCMYPHYKQDKIWLANESYTLFTLDQFKNFYLDNMQYIIEPNNVYILDTPIEDPEGWIIVGDSKHKRRLTKTKELINIANGVAALHRHSATNRSGL
jgi:hypothetical protein